MPLSTEEIEDMDNILGGNPKPSINRASYLDPDKQAEVISLSESRKIPMDTVERNLPELQRRERVEAINTDGYPKLTQWATDAKNSSVSIDDLDNLKGLEDAITNPPHNYLSNVARGTMDRINQLTGNLLEFAGTSGESIDQWLSEKGVAVPGIIVGDDGMSWTWDFVKESEGQNIMKEVGAGISDVSAYDYQPSFTWEKLKGDVTAKNLAGYIVEQGVKSLPDMAAAIYTLPAYIASRTEEIAEERVANNLKGEVTASDLATSLVPAVTTALLEKLGAKFTFGVGGARTATEALKATGGAALVEGGTEFLQEGVEYLGETLGTKKDVSMAEMFDRQLAGLVAGAGMGGGIRATSSSFEVALSKRTGQNIESSITSMTEQQIIDDVITYAQSSKTRERKSDRFQDFVAGLDPEKQIYISSQAVKEAIQSGVEFPTYVIDQIDGLDADIAIGVEQFATDMASNEELINAIRPHIKLSNDAITQSELDAGDDLSIKSLLEKAEKSQEIKSEADAIYDDIKDQLVDTGRQGEATARYSAAIIPAYVTVKAEQTGKSVAEIYEMMGLTIAGPDAQVREDAVVLDEAVAPSKESTSTGVSYNQDFGDLTFEDTRILSTSGKEVKITESAKVVWDRNIKRKNQAQKLMECLNAA